MNTYFLPIIVMAGLSIARIDGQTLDTVVFGNTTSESNHSLASSFSSATNINSVYWVNTAAPSDPSATPPSDVIAGGLGLSARRLLPRTPNGDVYGGQITFTMTVDPVKQNYFSLKMWAGDTGQGDLILNCNGREIGNRHGGGGLQEDPLWFQDGGWYANRFFYRTEPLPLSMTKGKTSVTITIRSLGSQFDYAAIFTYVPSYQHIMLAPTVGMYTAYTHAGTIPDVTGEAQGTAPAVRTPRTLENDATGIANVESSVNSGFAAKLNAVGSTLAQGDAFFLAQCYDAQTNHGASWIKYPSGMTTANVGTQITAALDAFVATYASNSSLATGGWGGELGEGQMGDAIRLAWPLLSGSMSTTVAYGGSLGTVTRQAGWSAALRASVDAGRYHRQNIANQALANATNIYYANRALLLVNPSAALNESEALRYVKEASGVIGSPWLGNDQATGGTDGIGGGPVPTYGTAPYGPNWYMCTSKGTSKDGGGFVGSDYGELGPWIYRLGLLSGDSQLQARGLTMTLARCQFRYPGVDESGYFIMMGTDPIGDRNNNLPSHYDYLGSGSDDLFLMASQGASVIGNACLGYFQEGMNDGQMVRNFDNGNPYLPTEWAAIKAMPQTGIVLPTASGQPDYAWVDEENMVVSAKHGEERFYANLYWRQPGFINGLAKVFHLTPTTAHLADVMIDDERFRPTGQYLITGTGVDNFATPPDNPIEAFSGLTLPIAWRSDLTSIPATNRDAGRGTGYTFRYGNWLVGIDADYSANYTVQLPSNFTSAPDLVSGKTMTGSIVLTPKTSVVLYLPTNVDPNPPPARTLLVNAVGVNGSVTVGWSAAGAATSYNVLRSTTSGGPYTTVASGVAAATYLDTTVTNGATYYYAVQSVNAAGLLSGNSPEASATPVASETLSLASPWSDADIGTSTGGNASVSAGTFTLKSGPGDIWSNTDGCHYLYQALVGDGSVTARVVSQSSTNSNAKSGVMLRDSLAGNGAEISLSIEPSKRSEMDYRNYDGNSTSNFVYSTNLTLPYWVRLVRTGGTVTGYVSPDNANWTLVGTASMPLPYVTYVGLSTSPANGSAGQTNTATFDNVTLPFGATSAPATPTGLVGVGSNTSATLNWSGVSGATSYNLKRGTNAGGPFTTVASGVILNSATDFGVVSGTYYYVVSAVNNAGESANSSPANVQTGLPQPSALLGLNVTPASGQVSLSWNASAGATSYIITRATAGGAFVVIATGVTGTNYTDASVTNGTFYNYGVAPVNASGQGQGSQASALPPGSIPAAWQSQDIGGPSPGGASYANGTFTLVGGGTDIWGTSDQFQYAYQAITGDCVITSRVATEQNSSPWDKLGVMMRNTLDANSAYYAVYVTSGSGVSSQFRSSAGNGAVTQSTTTGLVAPYWVRIVRVGSTFTSYRSPDGVTWTNMGAQTIAMNATICVGLVDSSNAPATLEVATFDNTSIQLSLASGGTATSSSGTSGQQAAQAFDGNTGTKWYDAVLGGTGWLQYQFGGGAAKVVSQYQITSANDVPQRDPAAWQFQGSNDGANWTTLDTQTSQAFANRYQANAYVTSNTTPYSYYRLNVTANAGGSGYGIQLSELTFFGPNTSNSTLAPLAPASLSAAWGSGQISLSWPSALGATSYNVKRATASGGPYTTVAPGFNATSYTDVSVANGTTYYYVVSALNSVGESPNSTEDSATPYAAPATPTGLVATAGDAQSTLTWTAVPGANVYDVQRASVSGGPYATVGTTTGTSYTDTGLTDNTTYYYVVAAMNLDAESADSTEVNIQPSNTPTNLAATPGNAQVSLTWTASLGSPLSYNVYRSTTSGNGFAQVATGVSMASYTDTTAANGTTYYYLVTGVYSYGEGTASAQASAKPMPPLPLAPTGLAAVGGTGQISLTWDPTAYAASYNLKRVSTSGGPYTTVASPGSNSYTDTNLGDGATYFYVVTAVNISGEGPASPEGSAPTLPGAVTGLSTVAGNNQVGLTWNATPGATSYSVGRSTTSGGPYSIIASGGSTTGYVDGSATNGITYYYVVTALDGSGAGPVSNEANALPLPPLPAAPSSFAAISGDAQVSLSWATTPYAASYTVSRATTTGGPYIAVTHGLATTNYNDGNLTNGTTYYYVVAAVDLAGTGPNSSEVNAKPLPPLPTAPTGLAAVAGDAQVSLNWNATTYAASYTIGRATTAGGPYATLTSGVTATSYVDTSAANGIIYYYVVAAADLAGTGPNSNEANAKPLPPLPAAPIGLAAVAGNGQVSLSWTASTYATSYNVKRATTSGGPYVTVGSPTSASYADSSLTNGTTYYYVVTALDLAGESGNSAEVNAKPLPPITAAPIGLAASAGNGQVSLSWTASTYATSYNVKRATTSGGPYVTVGSPTSTSYVDSSLTNGTTYYYVVTALNLAGESGNSAEVNAKPLPPIAAVPGGLAATGKVREVDLTWTAAANAASYNVKRAATSGGPYTTVAPNVIATSYNDTGLADNTTYYYVVSAVNLAGESANSGEASAKTLLGVPTIVTGLAVVPNSDQNTLNWTAVTGATGYTVGRSAVSGGPYTTLMSGITSTTYLDAGLVNGTTYYYVVAAVNGVGPGPNSIEVSGTPAAQNLYWDTTTAVGLANGSGAWDTGTTAKWSNSSTGTSNPLLTWLGDDNAFFQTAGTLTATLSGTIKLGSLTQAVAGTALTVTGGTLQIDSNAGLVDATGTNHSLIIGSPVVLNSANVIIDNEASAGSLQLNGVVSEIGGSRALTKIGLGTFTLGTVANTFSGGIGINSASQVAFGNNASFGTGPITFNAGTSLTSTAQIFTSSTGTVSALANNLVVTPGSFGAYVGNHTIILSGSLLNPGGGGNGTFSIAPGTSAVSVTLSGDNHAYAGSIVYKDNGTTPLLLGSVNAGSANARWTLTGGSSKGIGANVAGSNTFLLGELVSASGIGRLFNNQASGAATFVIGDATAAAPSFGGIVADGTAGGTVAVTKTGTDTQTLTGACTYTGATTIGGGTLLVNGSLAAGSTVTINAGATLGGTGTIKGAVNVASGGLLAPGIGGVGTLTFSGGLNLNGGGVLNFDLNTTKASDKIVASGAYVAPASGTATLNFNTLSGFGAGTYTLITGATGIGASNFTLGTRPSGYTYGLSATSGTLTLIVGGAPTGLAATTTNAEVDLTWTAAAGATSYNVLRSTTSGSGYAQVATGVTTVKYADTGLVNGTPYYYVVQAVNAGGTSGNSAQTGATPAAPPIVDSWYDNDIGTVAQTGSSSYSAGTFTLNGSGTGIGGTTDGIDFTYQTLVGDGTIIARVASGTSGESGVMIRETLAGNASEVDLLLQLNVGAVFQSRIGTGSTTTGATVGAATVPSWVKLARVGNVFTGYTSPDGVTWTQVGTITNAMASSVYVGLLQSSVTNTALSTGTFTNVGIVPTAAWASQDIGSVGSIGASYYSNAIATIHGCGANIYGSADQFRYTYLAASGDCDITARVTAVSNTNTAAKAGVMIRETLTTGSREATVAVTPGSGVVFDYRSATNGTTANTTVAGFKAPYWVRLVRSGNVFTASRSPDGITWTTLGTQTITMATTVYIGLPVCSASTSATCTATFDNVTADP